MKKLIFVLALMFAFAISEAQERTVTRTLPSGTYYDKYTGGASDVLIPTTRDTIDYIFVYQSSDYVTKIAVKVRFDMRTTADTTVLTSLFGKEFSDDGTYVEIVASSASSAVTANNVVDILVSDPYVLEAQYITGRVTGGDTVNVAHNHTPFDKSYRYYRLRLILAGNDSVGTGVNVDEIEFKIYTE
jgi:hypothetical protein